MSWHRCCPRAHRCGWRRAAWPSGCAGSRPVLARRARWPCAFRSRTAARVLDFGRKAVGVAPCPRTRCQEAFDHPVLDRMEGHNGQLATGLQRTLRGHQARRTARHIHCSPQCAAPESCGSQDATGRVWSAASSFRPTCKRQRGGDRRLFAGTTIALAMRRLARSSPYWNRILAISSSSASLHEIRRRGPVLAHPHIKRPVAHERKPALGQIKLHRGHAKIQHDPVQILCIVVHFGKHAALHDRSGRHSPGPVARHLKRQRIAVHGHHLRSTCVEQAARIAARAEGAVQPDAPHRGHRRQQGAQQNRDMGGGRGSWAAQPSLQPPACRPGRPSDRNPRAARPAIPLLGRSSVS